MELPLDEQTYLLSLSSSLPHLRSRVRSLRALGWTLDSIGRALGSPRSTARAWAEHPDTLPLPATAPAPPAPPHPNPHPTHSPHHHLHPALTLDLLSQIAHLSPLAARARAGTPPSSAYARARTELNALVRSLHYDHGVPIAQLARAAGVTYRAMSVRIKA